VVGVLIVAGPARAGAEALKVNGLIQIWGTVNGANIRLNAGDMPPNGYYNLRPEFANDGFTVRRTELRVSARPLRKLEFTVMADPSISTGSMVQDAVVSLRPMARLLLQVGQFKTQQTHEGLLSSGDLLFAERGQAARAFGDTRDRGAVASWSFGDSRVSGTASTGVFNGSGRRNDPNRTKDVVVPSSCAVERGTLPAHTGSWARRMWPTARRGRRSLSVARAPLLRSECSPAKTTQRMWAPSTCSTRGGGSGRWSGLAAAGAAGHHRSDQHRVQRAASTFASGSLVSP
jgi:hypothetical protein